MYNINFITYVSTKLPVSTCTNLMILKILVPTIRIFLVFG